MPGYVEGYFIKPHIMWPLTLLNLKPFFLELKPKSGDISNFQGFVKLLWDLHSVPIITFADDYSVVA